MTPSDHDKAAGDVAAAEPAASWPMAKRKGRDSKGLLRREQLGQSIVMVGYDSGATLSAPRLRVYAVNKKTERQGAYHGLPYLPELPSAVPRRQRRSGTGDRRQGSAVVRLWRTFSWARIGLRFEILSAPQLRPAPAGEAFRIVGFHADVMPRKSPKLKVLGTVPVAHATEREQRRSSMVAQMKTVRADQISGNVSAMA